MLTLGWQVLQAVPPAAAIKLTTKVDNVAGVKIPVFQVRFCGCARARAGLPVSRSRCCTCACAYACVLCVCDVHTCACLRACVSSVCACLHSSACFLCVCALGRLQPQPWCPVGYVDEVRGNTLLGLPRGQGAWVSDVFGEGWGNKRVKQESSGCEKYIPTIAMLR